MSYGAIIGDVAGSIYEWKPIKTKDINLFKANCKYTDDSVCTAAVADILLSDHLPSASEMLRQWCRSHPGKGYGGNFRKWIHNPDMGAYRSYGNGAAMRVSPAAYLNQKEPLEKALEACDLVTNITHNHPEGVRGARATTHAIWLALNGEKSEDIRKIIEDTYYYCLSRTVDQIRPKYSFNVTCQGSVSEAIICALESESFEDAILNAISLGGDADTQAAIAGSIAEALHGGIVDDLITQVKKFLSPDMIEIMKKLYSTIHTLS
ncbi:MAG: ADP-ribosylglycohydrolase family protein [Bacteroidetes bacterium]|nr:ADP-ribosylglycohydrolase family protein [Bacteroidota bacterium]